MDHPRCPVPRGRSGPHREVGATSCELGFVCENRGIDVVASIGNTNRIAPSHLEPTHGPDTSEVKPSGYLSFSGIKCPDACCRLKGKPVRQPERRAMRPCEAVPRALKRSDICWGRTQPKYRSSEGRQQHELDQLYQDSPGSGISMQNRSGTSQDRCLGRLKNRGAQGA
jgi:hypothetical protein